MNDFLDWVLITGFALIIIISGYDIAKYMIREKKNK
jgi:hypothetical protein